ncbi:RNA polymerase RpoN-/SigL-like sigma 54 subunit [Tumebacillus sp. BK434]|uniref:RNA polymerase factor sigma-54 n=1 Tax=Tumebacillus sp. BK434 TaxID=2512169 RepID=UPI0010E0E50F|nr:RNA polymerase factor sigma-54 [Tumebacillus sp. BK434]TCP55833.1 RNA polymerase RpoN-/SigL-like sigma 54 subunit [Tumebacillus sp. BK434]
MQMGLGYGLWQEQTQKLVMTTELRQAIALLQFSSLELLDYLESETQQNPVLEVERTIDWTELAKELNKNGGTAGMGSASGSQLEEAADGIRQGITLHDHLEKQLRLLPLNSEALRIGQYLIGSLDSNGYLTVSPEDCAEALGVTRERVLQALSHVQSLEPTGVGARDLAECLRLQLAEKTEVPPEIYPLIDHYLEDVAQGRITRVAGQLKVQPAEVQRMVDLLKTLDPKPGRMYSNEAPTYIIPDVTVERVGLDYVVLVNEKSTPRLRINDFYRNMLTSGDELHKETKEYISGKLNGALWLLKSIEQRRQTIFHVTSAIVELQRGFFEDGVRGLKPLTLRQVAEKVGLHESTVSRATTGKFAQTPRGVFELKYFFGSGVQTAAGDSASAESIKSQIKQLVAAENPKKPLSDQKLTELLQEKGIEIARRTVAKYREEENIPSSAQRKRYE